MLARLVTPVARPAAAAPRTTTRRDSRRPHKPRDRFSLIEFLLFPPIWLDK
jgi:hypothetical protein